eukprot:gene18126-biopygen9925
MRQEPCASINLCGENLCVKKRCAVKKGVRCFRCTLSATRDPAGDRSHKRPGGSPGQGRQEQMQGASEGNPPGQAGRDAKMEAIERRDVYVRNIDYLLKKNFCLQRRHWPNQGAGRAGGTQRTGRAWMAQGAQGAQGAPRARRARRALSAPRTQRAGSARRARRDLRTRRAWRARSVRRMWRAALCPCLCKLLPAEARAQLREPTRTGETHDRGAVEHALPLRPDQLPEARRGPVRRVVEPAPRRGLSSGRGSPGGGGRGVIPNTGVHNGTHVPDAAPHPRSDRSEHAKHFVHFDLVWYIFSRKTLRTLRNIKRSRGGGPPRSAPVTGLWVWGPCPQLGSRRKCGRVS